MPPFLALILWFVLLVTLFRWDPAEESKTPLALWVPLIWMFILGSRLPAQWIGSGSMVQAQALEEGDPLDRAVFLGLILLAIVILVSRSFKWGDFFARNIALTAFLSFALLSVVWSDFPFVALKRWFRDLGDYLVILVVLTDPRPLEAIRTLLRRLCYLLIPLSVLIIKYYPVMGKQYDPWSGVSTYAGATTSKNMLGIICLISGLFFFWDTATRWSNRRGRRTKRIIWINFALIAMSLWLLNLSNSATSRVCLVLGCMVIVAARGRWGKRNFGFLKVLIPATFCIYLVLALGFDMNGRFASAVGRDPTLTDRTLIWKAVLSTHTNPLVGTGYQTFWLGPRLQTIWQAVGHVNESHNGYLETYLNLGLIGVFLLVMFLMASYGTICQRMKSSSILPPLTLAIWSILLFYDVSEAAFGGGLLWMILLLGSATISERAENRVLDVAPSRKLGTEDRFPRRGLETASQRR